MVMTSALETLFFKFINIPRGHMSRGHCQHHVWPCVRVSFSDDISGTVSCFFLNIAHTQPLGGVDFICILGVLPFDLILDDCMAIIDFNEWRWISLASVLLS